MAGKPQWYRAIQVFFTGGHGRCPGDAPFPIPVGQARLRAGFGIITSRWEFDLMTFNKNLIAALGAAALLAAASSARADSDILGVDLYATGGDITVRFEGSSAGYDSLIA